MSKPIERKRLMPGKLLLDIVGDDRVLGYPLQVQYMYLLKLRRCWALLETGILYNVGWILSGLLPLGSAVIVAAASELLLCCACGCRAHTATPTRAHTLVPGRQG